MNILVTGGAGFIGSNFIHYWLDKYPGDKIINLDKLTYAGNLENLKDAENSPNYGFIQGDICDKKVVSKTIKGVDTVVHFAAESHVDRSIEDPAIFVKTNILGTQILLDAALEYNVKRFHHISTDEVFGSLNLDDNSKWTEESPYQPRSPYAASKASSDHLVRAYNVTYGLPISITNCSNNFGPYHYPEKLISLSITNTLEGKKIPVYGDGKYVRDWLYVKDHCRAIDAVLKKGKLGETYLVGGRHEEFNNIRIAKLILKIMGESEDKIEYVKDRPGHDRRYALDWSKIKNELNWEPKHNFEEALRKTVEWYKNNEEWWKPLKSRNHEIIQPSA
jgi:dTDP-glucose 4,6-dehydratase